MAYGLDCFERILVSLMFANHTSRKFIKLLHSCCLDDNRARSEMEISAHQNYHTGSKLQSR